MRVRKKKKKEIRLDEWDIPIENHLKVDLGIKMKVGLDWMLNILVGEF
jgi:hypothetical protein